MVTVPLHCGEAGVPEMVIPAGRVSVTVAPVMAVPVGLERVMFITEVCVFVTGEVTKTLPIPGLPTARVAEATPPVPALLEVTLPWCWCNCRLRRER